MEVHVYLDYLGSVARHNAYYGVGTGPILHSYLYCTGTETSLLECNRYYYGALNCNHRDDAGVTCEGNLHNYYAEIILIINTNLNSMYSSLS